MKVEIVPYNPEWKINFKEERKVLSEILEELNPVIEHIGSTSVEGLGAKPVIDIQIGVHEYEHLDMLIEKFIEINYVYVKKYEDVLPDRRYFVKVVNIDNDILPQKLLTYEDKINRRKYPHKYHVHCVELNSHWWKRHIAFRDYLRTHDNARDEYYKVKTELALKDWNDINDYADAKTNFVKSIERLAGIKDE